VNAPTTSPAGELRQALEHVLAGRDLDERAAEDALAALLDEGTPRALQAALLAGLRAKGESAGELAGFARGLLARARRVPNPARGLLLDTAGTGGDGRGSFNLSTAAALLLAALGLPVAKHGNRAVSSRAGSADLCEALGLELPREPEAAAAALARDGFVFLFAPHFQHALAALAALRRELGVRTVFNLLGPLVNPARPSHQVIGAPGARAARRLAEAARRLGLTRAFVVHGAGFDEATPCGSFELYALRDGALTTHTLRPADFGLAACRPDALAGGDARANAERLQQLFAGAERGPLRDAVCLNAALALLLVERASTPRAALRLAEAALDDGRAAGFLARLLRREGAT
jgi:anthranilate phosphoribosyltransferase